MRTTAATLVVVVAAAAATTCDGGVLIPNSNRSTPDTACVGHVGDECFYNCEPNFYALGRHVCQQYSAGGTTFINNAFFGGRCLPLCLDSPACAAHEVALRNNRTDCMETLCFESATAALQHVAQGAFAVWNMARNNKTGIYIDHVTLEQAATQDWTQGSAEFTGLGFLVECVADALGWQSRNETQRRVLQSLRSLTGGLPIPRTPQGFIAQFFDSDTGATGPTPYFGLMSSGLMAAGALFAQSYFAAVEPGSEATAAISALATQLWRSVAWASLLCNNGTLSPTGTGIPMLVGLFNNSCSAVQYPQADGFYEYNEEHYTVWFAYEAACAGYAPGACPNTSIEQMWQAWMGRRLNPNHSYANHSLLSMWSGYIVQLPFYSCASFNTDPAFSALFRSHWLADWAYYNNTAFAGERGRYGLGAGPTIPACAAGATYTADQIDQGSSYCRTYSPYVLAGYLGLGDADTQALISNQLLQLLSDGDTVAAVPSTPFHILWRKAMLEPAVLLTNDVTMVDFSSELLGLSTLWLGVDFFRNHTSHNFTALRAP